MLKIKCPNCGTEINIGKDEYNALLSEVEKEEIDKRVNERAKAIEEKVKAEYALESTKSKSIQDREIQELKHKNDLLNEQLKLKEKEVESAVTKATSSLKEEMSEKDKQIITLTNQVNETKKDNEIEIQHLKDKHKSELEIKEQEVEKWRSYRIGESTKELGESLEQYCHDAFDEIRATAYPDAYFEKDNDVDEEGKGDFIFRDFKDGIETCSIMFEMKTEKDTTKTKHKNEDFFAKLDKNRTSKNCEYAVLVSTLESDSKLYNKGIVDVSHRYNKMFVVRPQFFLAIIGLIRSMANNSYEYKKQLVDYRRQNIDVTNFEFAVRAISEKITSDYDKAEKIYSEVDKMCDDIVKKVETFRKEFKTATGWIEKAKNQLPNLEVRKLTRGNPTMKEKFAQLEEKEQK